MGISSDLELHPPTPDLLDKAAALTVEPTGLTGVYRVGEYRVVIDGDEWSCDCPARIRCKHLIAALRRHSLSGGRGRTLPPVMLPPSDPFEGLT